MKRTEIERKYQIHVEDPEDSTQGYGYAVIVTLDPEELDVKVASRFSDNELGFGHPDSLEAFADELKGIAGEMRKWPAFKPSRKGSK